MAGYQTGNLPAASTAAQFLARNVRTLLSEQTRAKLGQLAGDLAAELDKRRQQERERWQAGAPRLEPRWVP